MTIPTTDTLIQLVRLRNPWSVDREGQEHCAHGGITVHLSPPVCVQRGAHALTTFCCATAELVAPQLSTAANYIVVVAEAATSAV